MRIIAIPLQPRVPARVKNRAEAAIPAAIGKKVANSIHLYELLCSFTTTMVAIHGGLRIIKISIATAWIGV
jgi:hypothetical protein